MTTTTNTDGAAGGLTKSEQVALRECAIHRVGSYIWKPATMAKLAAKGLTVKCESGAYQLTPAGTEMVRVLREQDK
jgi:hypothetical protein